MRIFIDVRCLQRGVTTGVETFLWNILPTLFDLPASRQYTFVLFTASFKKYPASKRLQKLASRHDHVELVHYSFPSRLLNGLLAFSQRPFLNCLISESVDLIWLPNLHFSSFSKNIPVVQTVHDLSFLDFPEYYSFYSRLWHRFIRPLARMKRATHIVVPSLATSLLLQEHLSSSCDHSVIYHGKPLHYSFSHHRLSAFQRSAGIPSSYLLYVGALEPRKNLIALLHAYRFVRDQRRDVPSLVLAGHDRAYRAVLEREIESLGLAPFVHILSDFSDRERCMLYSGALALVYPSLYEGFGLPLVEAMQMGVPVLTSDRTALPEIVGSAGLCVDTGRPSDFGAALLELCSSSELRKALSLAGKKRASDFSWEKAAGEYLALFETL